MGAADELLAQQAPEECRRVREVRPRERVARGVPRQPPRAVLRAVLEPGRVDLVEDGVGGRREARVVELAAQRAELEAEAARVADGLAVRAVVDPVREQVAHGRRARVDEARPVRGQDDDVLRVRQGVERALRRVRGRVEQPPVARDLEAAEQPADDAPRVLGDGRHALRRGRAAPERIAQAAGEDRRDGRVEVVGQPGDVERVERLVERVARARDVAAGLRGGQQHVEVRRVRHVGAEGGVDGVFHGRGALRPVGFGDGGCECGQQQQEAMHVVLLAFAARRIAKCFTPSKAS